jgi:hypothetical protein
MSEENVGSGEGGNEPQGIAPEVVKEAESQGWVPKEKFRGNESDWVDADVFVKRGREILPILRKNNEHLLRDLNHAKEQLKEIREAAEEFKKFQKDAYDRKVRDYEAQINEIKQARAQAISDGDGTKVNQLDDALDQAKEELRDAKQDAKQAEKVAASEVPSNTPPLDPSLQSWLDRNTWFGQDKRMTAIVNGIGDSIRIEHPSLSGQAFLDKLDEVLAEEFPNKFGKQQQSPAGRVESGSGRQGRSSSSNARSYDNLPSDAKAACDRFVKQKLMTREQYVADFDWN